MKWICSSFLSLMVLLSSCGQKVTIPWYFDKTNSYVLLDLDRKTEIKVGVLDSGFYSPYQCLFRDETIVYGYDFIDQDDCPEAEYNLHGSFISYLIAGADYLGYRGIDSRLTLLQIRVFDDSGNTSVEKILKGMNYAIDSGCSVINMSFGSEFVDSDIQKLISSHPELYFVCSIGDSNSDFSLFPASLEDTLSVCAMDEKGKPYCFSNAPSEKDIKVPGVVLDIPSVNQEGKIIHTRISGSSYATAVLSGIIASSLLSDSLNQENLRHNNLYIYDCLDCRKFIKRR